MDACALQSRAGMLVSLAFPIIQLATLVLGFHLEKRAAITSVFTALFQTVGRRKDI